MSISALSAYDLPARQKRYFALSSQIAYVDNAHILPSPKEQTVTDNEWHQGYVEYWNSNENIGNYIRARAGAPYEIALFFEHMPYSVEPWLRDAATFLRGRAYLTDFGLVLDERFELTPDEASLQKDTPFPYPELTQLLQETGFLSGSV
jgi:hypothetical protein